MIAGRYTPLEPARRGAPRRARDQQTAQTVWLREVEVFADARGAAAASRAHAATGLIHPSLVALFDVIDLAPHRLLLAYEYVPAQTVRRMSGGGAVNPRRAAELMSEVSDGVAELHARGLVHGAINSDTVLVTLKGKAKLDRLADPSLGVPDQLDERSDLQGIILLLGELTSSAKGALPALDRILEHDGAAGLGSAAALAASLRLAAARP